MDLKTYLEKQGMTQKEFGDLVSVGQSLVSRWVKNAKTIAPEKAVVIEKKTRGVLKRRDLRPDIFA